MVTHQDHRGILGGPTEIPVGSTGIPSGPHLEPRRPLGTHGSLMGTRGDPMRTHRNAMGDHKDSRGPIDGAMADPCIPTGPLGVMKLQPNAPPGRNYPFLRRQMDSQCRSNGVTMRTP